MMLDIRWRKRTSAVWKVLFMSILCIVPACSIPGETATQKLRKSSSIQEWPMSFVYPEFEAGAPSEGAGEATSSTE